MTALTPIDLQPDALLALHSAHASRYPVLLQSAAQARITGRYDVLLACPKETLSLSADGSIRTNAPILSADSFLDTLDRWWMQERSNEVRTDLPFMGGWFLYLGYELADEIEPSLRLHKEHTVAQAIRIPAAIVFRHDDNTAWIVAENEIDRRTIVADLGALRYPKINTTSKQLLVGSLKEEEDSQYLDAVQKALEHIAAGDIYQANLSRRWQGTLAQSVRPDEVFRRLKRSNPSPFAALAVLDDYAIVSSSPERLIEIRDGNVSTRPIAGTRPRRADHHDDVARLIELHSHPKERAEHIMLIDLERNDLGRICEPGSVVVDEFMTLESYAHVHHIVSNVRGRLRMDVTPGQAISAVFPGGTITGCPKVRCMQIIAELERTERGAYTGSLGYLNLDGSMDLNILIRTIEMRGRELYFRAGAGIVADSIPEKELEETRAKARGLINALEQPW